MLRAEKRALSPFSARNIENWEEPGDEASSEYGMTFTLLACETPPSSYEAEPAVRVGRSVNSLIRVYTPRACIGGQVRLKFDGKYC